MRRDGGIGKGASILDRRLNIAIGGDGFAGLANGVWVG